MAAAAAPPPEIAEEVEALQAIYGEEAVTVAPERHGKDKAGARGGWRLEVELQPLVAEGDALAWVSLALRVPPGYPMGTEPEEEESSSSESGEEGPDEKWGKPEPRMAQDWGKMGTKKQNYRPSTSKNKKRPRKYLNRIKEKIETIVDEQKAAEKMEKVKHLTTEWEKAQELIKEAKAALKQAQQEEQQTGDRRAALAETLAGLEEDLAAKIEKYTSIPLLCPVCQNPVDGGPPPPPPAREKDKNSERGEGSGGGAGAKKAAGAAAGAEKKVAKIATDASAAAKGDKKASVGKKKDAAAEKAEAGERAEDGSSAAGRSAKASKKEAGKKAEARKEAGSSCDLMETLGELMDKLEAGSVSQEEAMETMSLLMEFAEENPDPDGELMETLGQVMEVLESREKASKKKTAKEGKKERPPSAAGKKAVCADTP